MSLTLSVDILNTHVTPTDPITIVVTAANAGTKPVQCREQFGLAWSLTAEGETPIGRGSGFYPNEEGRGEGKPTGHTEPLAAGGARVFTHLVDVELDTLFADEPAVTAHLSGTAYGDEPSESFAQDITIDLSDTVRLKTPDGDETFFFVSSGELLFCHHARAQEQRPIHRLGKAKASALDLLSPEYLHFGKKIIRNAKSVRGADAGTFEVLGRTFAKDKGKVHSLYGDADIRDPASFESCPPPKERLPLIRDQIGWGQSGYGRDRQFLYFFDRDTETAKARIIKSCKSPKRFIALSDAVGHDGTRVFYKGQIIKGADPETFEPLNDGYSRDAKRVYYAAEPLSPPVDPAVFEVLPGSPWTGDPRPSIAYSDQGRAGDVTYKYGFADKEK